MMQIIDKGKVKGIVLEDNEEIIIYSSKKGCGGTSIKRIGEKQIHSSLNENELNFTFEERELLYQKRATKIKKQKHNWYIKNKGV